MLFKNEVYGDVGKLDGVWKKKYNALKGIMFVTGPEMKIYLSIS